MWIRLLGIMNVGFDTCIYQIWKKNGEYGGLVQLIFIDFMKAYDSVRRVVLNSILTEFGIL